MGRNGQHGSDGPAWRRDGLGRRGPANGGGWGVAVKDGSNEGEELRQLMQRSGVVDPGESFFLEELEKESV